MSSDKKPQVNSQSNRQKKKLAQSKQATLPNADLVLINQDVPLLEQPIQQQQQQQQTGQQKAQSKELENLAFHQVDNNDKDPNLMEQLSQQKNTKKLKFKQDNDQTVKERNQVHDSRGLAIPKIKFAEDRNLQFQRSRQRRKVQKLISQRKSNRRLHQLIGYNQLDDSISSSSSSQSRKRVQNRSQAKEHRQLQSNWQSADKQSEDEDKSSEVFNKRSVEQLLSLLVKETKSRMKMMKDVFKSGQDYLQHVMPLFINETLTQIYRSCDDYMRTCQYLPLPLRMKLSIDREYTVLNKYLVLKGEEDMFDHIESGHGIWRKVYFNEYQDFKCSNAYVIQLLIFQDRHDLDMIDLLGILIPIKYKKKPNNDVDRKEERNSIDDSNENKEKDKKKNKVRIFLPWIDWVINAFRFRNIDVQNNEFLDYDVDSYLGEMRSTYTKPSYSNFKDLYQREFLCYLNPIMNPSTYLIELKSLMKIEQSEFLKCILNPREFEKPNRLSQESYEFGMGMNRITKKFLSHPQIAQQFNNTQIEAINHACDYAFPFTVINGPPGTGKTFTSLGIISIVLEYLKDSSQQGVILACGHSNTVVNDWVRKITTSIIDHENVKQKSIKVLRIGVPEKCDVDIHDYCLEIKAQRKFFRRKLNEDQQIILKTFFEQKKQITLAHVKNRIIYLNEQIYENHEIINLSCSDEEKSRLFTQLNDLNHQKKQLKEVFEFMTDIIHEEKQTYISICLKIIQGTQVIVSTLTSSCSSILQKYLEHIPVVMCIIDEAPMCFEPSTLIPIVNYNVYKLVLIGDHKQLGPIIHDQENTIKYNYQRSLYERFIPEKAKLIMLNVQYRSMPILSIITSKFFYNSKIEDHSITTQIQFPDYLKGLVVQGKNCLFFDVQDAQQQNKNKSFFNLGEAYGVLYLLQYLLSKIDKSKQNKERIISIISPYKAQVNKIKQLLMKNSILNQVEVNTVDAYQGKENDIMIISLVRTEGLGFLKDERRANVATSRAQYCQFIFGYQQALVSEKEHWKKIYEFMHKRSQTLTYGHDQMYSKAAYFQRVLRR